MPVQFNRETLPPLNEGECHIAVVLLVDCSGSMSGAPIQELNLGLSEFGMAIQGDSLALGRADVCVISFNSTVQTEMPFRPATQYEVPVLSAGGLTSFNEGIEIALNAIEARKNEYKAGGVKYYRPWLFCLTDGAPTDDEKEADVKARLQQAIADKKVTYLPMGIGAAADIAKLKSYYPEHELSKPVLRADASNFKEAFQWLSASISKVSASDAQATTAVETPVLPNTLTISI